MNLKKLAFLSQLVAVSFIIPAPFMTILGPFFLWMLAYAFLGGKWALFYIGIDSLVDLPQFFMGSSGISSVAAPGVMNLQPAGLAVVQSLNYNAYAVFGLVGILLAIEGFLVLHFVLGSWRIVKRIRARVPAASFYA